MKKIDIIAGAIVIIAVIFIAAATLLGPEQQRPPPPPELEVTIDIVRDQPEPEPVPEPEPRTAPTPTPKPEAPEEPDDSPGTLPPLRANYRKYVGFQRYAEGMFRAGADFYVTGAKRDTLLKIDFGPESLRETSVTAIASRGYSPRTRVISNEPALKKYIDLARNKHGSPNPEVIMLVPQTLESRLAKEIHRSLKSKGASLHDVTSLSGTYRLENHRLVLHIEKAFTPAGTHSLNLPIRI